MNIPIYTAEASDGLEQKIKESTSIAYLSPLTKCEMKEEQVLKLMRGTAECSDDDLYYNQSVFVSSNWNLNDDVFGQEDVWAARHTPTDKPTNIGHDETQGVGHIKTTWAIDSEGNLISNDVKAADLPPLFHLVVGSVIYKHWKDPDLVARAEGLIDEIEADSKFVSMEVLFPNFDYAIQTPTGEYHTIPRGESTAWLTKHLRAYGGQGEFKGHKIGRLLRNMNFCGKGYVDNPGNPFSIIFNGSTPNFSNATEKNPFSEEKGVYILQKDKIETPKESNMAENFETQVAELKSELAKSQEQNKKMVEDATKAERTKFDKQIAELTEALEASKSETKEADEKLAEADKNRKAVEAELVEIKEAKAELEAKIAKAEADAKLLERTNTLVEAGADKENAESTAKRFQEFSDEQFEEIVTLTKAAHKADEVDTKDDADADADADSDATLDAEDVDTDKDVNLADAGDTPNDEMKQTRSDLKSWVKSAVLKQDTEKESK